MNFLLVDDDAVFNLLNRKILERMGVAQEIHSAQNGQEAINLLNRYFNAQIAIPDIILLDLNMPVMNGFEFLEAFKRLPLSNKADVKIIIVSSSTNAQDISKAKAMGANRYLTKPITANSLLMALQ
jgi:CheY-like chemotaxis protein